MISYELRCAEVTRFYYSATQLTSASQNPLAHAAVRFLSPENCSVTEPLAQDGLWGLNGKLHESSPSITPLFPEDRKIHDHFAKLIDEKRIAYSERERSVYIPAGCFSAALGGLVLIHEGAHAYAHSAGLWRDLEGSWSHWLEEAHVFASELNILHTLHPDLYEQSVIPKAAELKEKYQNEGFLEKDILIPEKYAAMFVESLAENPTEDDVQLARSILGIGAVYYMFSNGFTLSDASLTHSAHFLSYLYKTPKDPVPAPRMHMPLAISA